LYNSFESKVMADMEPTSENAPENCELIATVSSISIPGPFIMSASYVWFQATEGGRVDKPPIKEREAGEITRAEANEIIEKGLECLKETPRRLDALEAITAELQADDWKFAGNGQYWFSRRFKRQG
jgi:hypothetical protein